MLNIKKILPFIVGFGLMFISFSTSTLFKDPTAPRNYTGAPRATAPIGQVRYCNNSGCHDDNTLNTAGGSVVATGLPSGTYTAGQVYNFTIKITHGASDRNNWGFAVKAVNTVNNEVVGTFSTTNANASVKGTLAAQDLELSHNGAVTSAGASYTYTNLKWTAPAIPGANDGNIRFYIVGVAGDLSSDEFGDFTYSTTVSANLLVLPVTISSFKVYAQNNSVNINWQTTQEINTAHFELETSANGSDWLKKTTVNAKGNSVTVQSYTFLDKSPVAYNSIIYYRLKIVDNNGTYKYSTIQTVNIKNEGIVIDNLSAQPLSSNSQAIFKIHSSNKREIVISVSDVNGRRLYNQNSIVLAGTNEIVIPFDKLGKTSGYIFIKFATKGFQKTVMQLIN